MPKSEDFETAVLKALLRDQRVDFHAHDRGNRECVKWGDHVHLHKYLRSPWKHPSISYPLDSPGDPHLDGVTEKEFFLVNREVRQALKKSPEIVRELIKEVANTVERYSSAESRSIRNEQIEIARRDEAFNRLVENAMGAARRIAAHFELDGKIEKDIIRRIEDRFVSYTSYHRDSETMKLVKIHQSHGTIEIGPLHNPSGSTSPRRKK